MDKEKQLKDAQDAAKQMAEKLSAEMNTKVIPLVFRVEEDKEPVVGYIKEPNRMVKLAVMDKYASGFYSACAQVLPTILIKEHSDPRLSSELSKDDLYFMGAVYAVSELIQFASNQVGKKN